MIRICIQSKLKLERIRGLAAHAPYFDDDGSIADGQNNKVGGNQHSKAWSQHLVYGLWMWRARISHSGFGISICRELIYVHLHQILQYFGWHRISPHPITPSPLELIFLAIQYFRMINQAWMVQKWGDEAVFLINQLICCPFTSYLYLPLQVGRDKKQYLLPSTISTNFNKKRSMDGEKNGVTVQLSPYPMLSLQNWIFGPIASINLYKGFIMLCTYDHINGFQECRILNKCRVSKAQINSNIKGRVTKMMRMCKSCVWIEEL